MPLQPDIRPLPPPTASFIRSSTIISSLPQALLELIQNSLDARSRNITVHLDVENDGWGIRVEDDGEGMSPQTIEAIGRGERYGTSKSTTGTSLALQSTFGFRGEALPSLATLAMLEIVSTTASSSSYSCIIKGGRTLHLGPSARYKRSKPGTTVILKDLFYNLPIRRTSSPSSSAILSSCKRTLETASMLFPAVGIGVYERNRVDRARDVGGRGEGDGGKIWSVGKTGGGVLGRFGQIHGVGLISSVSEIFKEKDRMRIEGFISTQGAPSKAYEYLYVNRHPLSHCELHRAIEARFERSSFARETLTDIDVPNSSSQTRSASRKAFRKPVFVLNLSVSPRKLDLNLEPAKAAVQFEDWKAVTDFLVSVVDDFLQEQGLLIAPPLRRPTRALSQAASVSGSARGTLSSSWGAMKRRPVSSSASASKSSIVRKRKMQQEKEKALEYDLDLPEDTPLTRWRDPDTDQLFLLDPRTGHSFIPGERLVDPSATQDDTVFGEKRRTLKRRRGSGDGAGGKEAAGWLKAALDDFDSPTFPSRTELLIPTLHDSSKQPSIHACPDNPFHTHPNGSRLSQISSQPLPSSSQRLQALPILGQTLTRAALRTAEFVQQVDRKFLMVNVKLIQEVFPEEEVVGGVSASRMDGEKKALKSCLVLIDQHAADERLRVERFLKLFGEGFLSWSPPASSLPAFPASSSSIDGIPTTPTPSLLILLTAPEHSHLAAHPRTLLALARWGILLRISSLLPSSSSTNPLAASQQETAFHQIHVDAVPALLHERLVGRRAPKTKRGTAGEGPVVLEQVVKEFLGVAMADGGEGIVEGILRAGRDRKGEEVGSKQEREEGKQRTDWLGVMRFCPTGLLNLIDSKACRGAIMFNDPLTQTQAENLISQLARSVFPFQCAHGRPSMVPIANLEPLVLSSRRLSVDKPQRGKKPELDWEGFGLDG